MRPCLYLCFDFALFLIHEKNFFGSSTTFNREGKKQSFEQQWTRPKTAFRSCCRNYLCTWEIGKRRRLLGCTEKLVTMPKQSEVWDDNPNTQPKIKSSLREWKREMNPQQKTQNLVKRREKPRWNSVTCSLKFFFPLFHCFFLSMPSARILMVVGSVHTPPFRHQHQTGTIIELVRNERKHEPCNESFTRLISYF